MATTKNDGWYEGSIIVYKSFSGTLYGVKVLKEIYVDEINQFRWIYQSGRIVDNKFVGDGGDAISISTSDDLKSSYDLVWTPDKELSPSKGDILTGKNGEGDIVVLYFESTDMVHRLNPLSKGGGEQSNASLAFYQRKLTGLKILTHGFPAKKFSSIF